MLRDPVAEDDDRRRPRRRSSTRTRADAAASHPLHVDLAEQARRAGTAARAGSARTARRARCRRATSTYCVVSASATPTIRPPTTAPSGLSNPPSAAAANANTRIACIDAAVSAGRRRDDERAGQRAERGGEPPAEHQHRADRHADQPARLGVRRDRAQREPDLRLLQQQVQQHALDREHADEHERVGLTIDAAEVPAARSGRRAARLRPRRRRSPARAS